MLLVRHTYARRREWDIPGGFLHPAEDPEVALRRELREELGVTPTAVTSIAVTPSRFDHKREQLYTFVVDVPDEAVRVSEAEIAEARWFPQDALPAQAGRFARRMVARSAWDYWTTSPMTRSPGRRVRARAARPRPLGVIADPGALHVAAAAARIGFGVFRFLQPLAGTRAGRRCASTAASSPGGRS